MTVRERLAKGEFNYMESKGLPDGSVLVTLLKRGDPHIYQMAVQDLYQPNEKVLWEKVTPPV